MHQEEANLSSFFLYASGDLHYHPPDFFHARSICPLRELFQPQHSIEAKGKTPQQEWGCLYRLLTLFHEAHLISEMRTVSKLPTSGIEYIDTCGRMTAQISCQIQYPMLRQARYEFHGIDVLRTWKSPVWIRIFCQGCVDTRFSDFGTKKERMWKLRNVPLPHSVLSNDTSSLDLQLAMAWNNCLRGCLRNSPLPWKGTLVGQYDALSARTRDERLWSTINSVRLVDRPVLDVSMISQDRKHDVIFQVRQNLRTQPVDNAPLEWSIRLHFDWACSYEIWRPCQEIHEWQILKTAVRGIRPPNLAVGSWRLSRYSRRVPWGSLIVRECNSLA